MTRIEKYKELRESLIMDSLREAMNQDYDLYSDITCALMHNVSSCDNCLKCGEDGIDCRMNLVRRLAKVFEKELPWVDTKGGK